MNRLKWYGPSLVVLLTVMVIMFAGPRLVRDMVFAQESAHIQLASQSLEQSEVLTQLSEAFRNVADTVRPSVVSITTYANPKRKPRRSQTRPFGNGPFEDFFRQYRRQAPDSQEEQKQQQNEYERYDKPQPRGTGSGWVYDTQGHIITNNHVIKDAVKIQVRFANGQTLQATVVGTDPDTDVAVIKVDDKHLHPAHIATEPVHQGEFVFAFGSPLRFAFSMSQGIVSATNRDNVGVISQAGGYENFIQTDAAINQGNSGGPLTNLLGQVVGMNTAIATTGGRMMGHGGNGSIGIGFAIPVSMVVRYADQIIENGIVQRGHLGIAFAQLDAKQAKTFGHDGAAVVINDLVDDGPADQAGLQAGDILLAINDTAIDDGQQLRRLVASHAPGTTIDLKIFRQGKEMLFQVVLAKRPDAQLAGQFRRDKHPGEEHIQDDQYQILRKVGIQAARTFTQKIAKQMEVAFTPGILIIKIRPDSIAHQAQLMKTDIITHVMGQPVTSLKDLVEQLEQQTDRQTVRLKVTSPNSRSRFVYIEIPKN